MLQGRRVVVGVGGSIAAYRAAELVRELLRRGAEVRCILTEAGARFIGPALLAACSGQPVATDLFAPGAPEHVALAAWAEAAVVAPATADVLGRAAAGLGDDYLATWLLAFPGPVLFCPAMNRHMWSHPAVRRNIETLRAAGARVLEPGFGALGARGEGEGWGRLREPAEIADALGSLLAGGAPDRRAELPPPRPRSLEGRRVVVTAGPTREMLDPFRFLSNPSSARMGYAVAEAARDRGAAVVLVSGPAALPAPAGVTLRAVTTALEMHAAVMEATAEPAAIAVGAAAVADFRPAEVSPVKIKRPHAEGAEAVLRLVANPDIIAAVGRGRRAAVVVGFSAEAGLGPEEAERKLHAKRLDLCVWNDVREADSGFGAESERAVLVDAAGGREDLGLLPKRALAERILDRAEALLRAAGTRP
jgi:phosphopantothenoylcysteine decarboxylase/phosphopantothenate--cysteine ligase